MMKCIFCSKLQQPGKGVILAMNDGRILYFCSSKCKKNYKLGRNPKKTKWVRPAEKVKKKVEVKTEESK
ncbi:MAG: 50S ribosomal protein L24e [Candidatus Pacearchaeota archaeon]|nr:50S ribosomal protein L24e [Candidatus Pacearchaeota archaeon]